MKLIKPSISYHRIFALVLLSFTLLTTSKISYSAYAYEELTVDLYTLTGEFETIWNPTTHQDDPDPTNPRIKETAGTLFLTKGFIPINNRIVNAKALGISLSAANALNGKYVVSLNTWVSLNAVNGVDSTLSNFPRSTETYDFGGIPHVTVSVKGSSGSGQTNTTGNVCTSTVTTITAGNPVVSISAVQPNAAEAGPISGRFQIDLDAPRAKKTTVVYSISSGTATNGKDYAKIKNLVVIPAGTTSAYVDIVPINDRKKEVTETVTLNIKASGAYTLGTTVSASVNIADND